MCAVTHFREVSIMLVHLDVYFDPSLSTLQQTVCKLVHPVACSNWSSPLSIEIVMVDCTVSNLINTNVHKLGRVVCT